MRALICKRLYSFASNTITDHTEICFDIGKGTQGQSAETTPTESRNLQPEVEKEFNATKYEYDKMMCTCDLTKYSCDINCCCDEECSTEDKGAFRGKGARYYKMHTSLNI